MKNENGLTVWARLAAELPADDLLCGIGLGQGALPEREQENSGKHHRGRAEKTV